MISATAANLMVNSRWSVINGNQMISNQLLVLNEVERRWWSEYDSDWTDAPYIAKDANPLIELWWVIREILNAS